MLLRVPFRAGQQGNVGRSPCGSPLGQCGTRTRYCPPRSPPARRPAPAGNTQIYERTIQIQREVMAGQLLREELDILDAINHPHRQYLQLQLSPGEVTFTGNPLPTVSRRVMPLIFLLGVGCCRTCCSEATRAAGAAGSAASTASTRCGARRSARHSPPADQRVPGRRHALANPKQPVRLPGQRGQGSGQPRPRLLPAALMLIAHYTTHTSGRNATVSRPVNANREG